MAFLLFAYSVIARLFHLSFDLSHAKQAKGEIENNSCGTTEGFYSVNTEKKNKSNAFKSPAKRWMFWKKICTWFSLISESFNPFLSHGCCSLQQKTWQQQLSPVCPRAPGWCHWVPWDCEGPVAAAERHGAMMACQPPLGLMEPWGLGGCCWAPWSHGGLVAAAGHHGATRTWWLLITEGIGSTAPLPPWPTGQRCPHRFLLAFQVKKLPALLAVAVCLSVSWHPVIRSVQSI